MGQSSKETKAEIWGVRELQRGTVALWQTRQHNWEDIQNLVNRMVELADRMVELAVRMVELADGSLRKTAVIMHQS